MTKSETRELEMIRNCLMTGWRDIAARSLSALIRATMSKATRQQLIDYAKSYDLNTHPEFIIDRS